MLTQWMQLTKDWTYSALFSLRDKFYTICISLPGSPLNVSAEVRKPNNCTALRENEAADQEALRTCDVGSPLAEFSTSTWMDIMSVYPDRYKLVMGRKRTPNFYHRAVFLSEYVALRSRLWGKCVLVSRKKGKELINTFANTDLSDIGIFFHTDSLPSSLASSQTRVYEFYSFLRLGLLC